MATSLAELAAQLGVQPQYIGIAVFVLVIAIIWSIAWKGLALWKSARLNQPIWFILLLVINTFGILEILYIFLFSEIDLTGNSRKAKSKIRRRK